MRSGPYPIFLFFCLLALAGSGCTGRYHTFADHPGFTEYYADRCRDTPTPPPAGDRELLQKHRPLIVLAPGEALPIDFYRDYLPYTSLKSHPDGRVLETRVTRELLQEYRRSRGAYLDFDRRRFRSDGRDRRAGRKPAKDQGDPAPVVYGRVYRERVHFPAGAEGPDTLRLTFLKYNFLFSTSGLPRRLDLPSRILLFLSGIDPGDWHELDNFVAAHVVLDEADEPVAVILAQHNHHRTYLVGRDIFPGADGRFVFEVARRSNEIYPAGEDSRPGEHRVIRWSLHLDYLLSGENAPGLKAWDVTMGIKAGGIPVECELLILSPCDPLYTSEMLLGETRSLFGLYIGRDGPPGSDYYTVPELLPLGNTLKFAYLHEGDARDIASVRAAVDRRRKTINVNLLLEHGGRRLREDWMAVKTRRPP